MNYRREIDGLRSVAVLPVILFHGGFTVFSGGYVGVDVFFVISGYLITTIIHGETRHDRFSILTFYERRALRILPALTLVALCCLPFAVMWMIPSQQRDFAQSLVAVFVFLSNFYFWRENDYFAAEAEESPLLHTWSLAVEEQYYLIFPLLLLGLLRYRDRVTVWVLVLVSLFSLGLADYASRHYPTANFYLTPPRAWELLCGSLCALALADRPQPRNGPLAALGLALIVGAIFLYDDQTPFPSLYAVAPVGGAVLIILFGATGTLTARLLSMRIPVGIGLISYSAYLWHQPLFAFARIRAASDPPVWLMLTLAALALALAAVSWRFVEQPFRRRRPGTRTHVLALATLTSVIFIAVGLVGAGRNGLFGGQFNDPAVTAFLDEQVQPNHGLAVNCGPGTFGSEACRTGPDPVIAVWGDSFAAHLVEGIVASDTSVPIVQMTYPQCGPFADAAPYAASLGQTWSESCLQFNAEVMDWLRATPSVRYVVLSSPFRAYVSEEWSVLHAGKVVPSSVDRGVQLFRQTLAEIEAMGKHAVVVSPTPQSGINIGRCLAIRTWLGEDASACDFRLEEANDITKMAAAFLDEIASDYRVIRLWDEMCPDGICRTVRDKIFIYFDHAHLTEGGSRLIGRDMGLVGLIMQ